MKDELEALKAKYENTQNVAKRIMEKNKTSIDIYCLWKGIELTSSNLQHDLDEIINKYYL
jgi:hypothetical protein